MYRPTSTAENGVLSDLRVLYVDGSPNDREQFARMFGRVGADVTTVATASEALEMFDVARPELIVSRIGLPDADGYSLIRSIRNRSDETGGRTPAIAVAGWAGEHERQTAIDAGFTEHLGRPLEFERLVDAIARVATEIDATRRLRKPTEDAHMRFAAYVPRRDRVGFGNHVLDTIDREAGDVLAGALEYVELGKDDTLFNVGDAPRYVFFPCGAVVSLLRIAESGKTVEVCPIGPDGLVGLSGLLGGGTAAHWSRALVPGGAWRVGRGELFSAFDANASLRAVMLHFVYGQLAEISLVAACTRAHTIDQQVARWLLTIADRAGSSELPLTHERIADRLGTRRSSISLALEAYRRAGHVALRRGQIRIVDRPALEGVACECYRAIKAEYGWSATI